MADDYHHHFLACTIWTRDQALDAPIFVDAYMVFHVETCKICDVVLNLEKVEVASSVRDLSVVFHANIV